MELAIRDDSGRWPIAIGHRLHPDLAPGAPRSEDEGISLFLFLLLSILVRRKGRQKRDLLPIRRPLKSMHARFESSDLARLSARERQRENLRNFAAVGQECDRGSIGRPTRVIVGARTVRQTANARSVRRRYPDLRRHPVSGFIR